MSHSAPRVISTGTDVTPSRTRAGTDRWALGTSAGFQKCSHKHDSHVQDFCGQDAGLGSGSRAHGVLWSQPRQRREEKAHSLQQGQEWGTAQDLRSRLCHLRQAPNSESVSCL